jgi:hypothetical protein
LVYFMSRTRTISEPPVVGQHRNAHQGVPGSNIADTTMSSFSSICVDTITPGFRQLQREGVVVINPCTITVARRTTTGSGSVVQVENGNPSNFYTASGNGTISGYYQKYGGGFPSYTVNPPPDIDKLDAIAKQSCLANVDSTPFAFGEDLLEIKQTIAFLRNPLHNLHMVSRSFANLWRRRKFLLATRGASAKEISRSFTSLYLEQRFAVGPLLRSISSLMEAYEMKETLRPERRTARGFASIPKKGDNRIVSNVDSGGRTLTWQFRSFSEASVRTGIIYEVSNPIVNFQYKYGLRFKDIPETLWAVSPYSFMIDRVYNLSNFFSGAINLLDPNVKILGAWSTRKSEYTLSRGVRSISESGYSSTIVPDDIVDFNFVYERQVWNPTLADSLPTFDLKGLVNSSVKVADLLALVYQNFRP